MKKIKQLKTLLYSPRYRYPSKESLKRDIEFYARLSREYYSENPRALKAESDLRKNLSPTPTKKEIADSLDD